MLRVCEECGFECHSEKLYMQHKERESLGLTELEQQELIKKRYNDSRRN